MSSDKQACKVFCGGLSWETSSERLRAYFENFGVVREAFVSYNRNNGRPRGFGFVVFESPEVADKVVASKHTIDRREVECKKAVPKEEAAPGSNVSEGAENSGPGSAAGAGSAGGRTRKVFVGGLAPGVDEKLLRQHFEQFGTVEDAVVMYDHDNKRPRGFGFVTFTSEDSVDKVFSKGAMQTILDKQIEIKAAVPRDQMPPPPALPHHHGRNMGYYGYGGGYGYGRGQPPPMGMYGMPPPYGGPPPPRGGPGYGPRGPGPQHLQGPGNWPGYGNRAGGGRGGMAQQYMNALAPGFAGGQQRGPGGAGGGGYSGGGKGGLPAGYEHLYAGLQQPNGNVPHGGMNFPNNTSAAALYNLAGFNPQVNQQSNGSGKLNAFNNQLNLNKALGALASLGAFPAQGGGEGYTDSNTYGAGGQEEYDTAAAAAAAAGGLGVQSEYGFGAGGHDNANFTTSPAPGWSS